MLDTAYTIGGTLFTIFTFYRYFVTKDDHLLNIGTAYISWDFFYILLHIVIIHNCSIVGRQVGLAFV